MANRIQLRRGIKSKLPTLDVAEGGWCTDTYELFVGTGSGNVNMNGSKWYTGTDMSVASGSNNSYSTCPLVKLGDMYLNTSNGNVYECTTAGSGSSAKWTYKGSLKGDKGDRGANATIVIAASNSLTKSKTAADYTCTGSGDQSTITTALSALPSTGGKIVFLEGTYNISSAFSISKNVVFEGMGDGTQFNVSGSLATCSAAVNVVFRDMKITANTISKYLYKGGGSDNVLLDNVTLTMTAIGVHNLAIQDADSAFIDVTTFTVDNSRISVSATNAIHSSSNNGCYAIINVSQNGGYNTSHISNSRISLDGTNGAIRISRNKIAIINCQINITSKDASNYASIACNSSIAHIVGCMVKCSGSVSSNHNEWIHNSVCTNTNFTSTSPSYIFGTFCKLLGCTYSGSFAVPSSSNAVLCQKE